MKNKQWADKKLCEVCEIVNGGTPDTKIPEFWGGDHLWITPKDMGKLDGIFVDNTARKITDAGLKNTSAKILPINSIILSSRAPIGYLAINRKAITTNQGCKGLVPNDELLTMFLFCFLKNSVALLNDLGSGTTFKEISSTKLAGLKISLPPIPEQRRIVSILDKSFAAIDKAKANAEKNLANSRELFESYLKKAFDNSDKKYEEKKIEQVCENLDSQRIPVTKRYRNNGKYPYYGASGIVDYIDQYIFDEDLLLVSEDGANLLARNYPIAFSISGKTWVNNHAHVLRFENNTNQKYVEYYLNLISLDKYISGMAQPKLNQTKLNSIVLPFPRLNIQKILVSKLDALSAETKKLEAIYKKKLADLEELKKSLLNKAFQGEL